MNNRRSIKVNQRNSRRKKRVIKWLVIPLLVIAISALSYGTFLYNKAQTAMEDSYDPIDRISSKRNGVVNPDIDNISVLFIGVDDSEKRGFSTNARSDALMLATFNEKAKSIKLLSIPRDSYVTIPGRGQDKITHAHAYGGPLSTIETVEELLDIPVDFYVKMNFNAFIDIVDALDGITVDVPYAFSEQDSKDRQDAISFQEGLQHLDGEEALALARTRKLDSDIERGKRQQEILKAIINRAASAGSITKYGDLIDAVGNNMATDLSFAQMKSFIDYVIAGTSLNIETLTLTGQDLYLSNYNGNRVYYYQLDEENLWTIQTTLKSHLDLTQVMTSGETTESMGY
ncbi:LCP family protein [Bacillus sp. V3B]|uniref:LCP family protein n=1 Tax=Bacillus sp. V3B TaxID=2804915 RepID=UPI00210ADCCE|nr:LCP family protein [Bacillus sp. V3B]MCQ6277119.1 LCP family protein [Bacillus sp. V3B]